MHKILLLFNTVKFLKPMQIYFRIFYFIRHKIRNFSQFEYPLSLDSTASTLHLEQSIVNHVSYIEKNHFIFLNLSKKFDQKIDWNSSEYGKLWLYNLNYFEFLNQKEINISEALFLMNDFIDNSHTVKDGLEPFPTSLRAMNWIKFLSHHQIQHKKIEDSLYAQYYLLLDNLEYHLYGNHLLENAFSLLFGSYYFQDEMLYKKAQSILTTELNEQILEDGAHFELSPMYHQLMLFRLLDAINLIQNNQNKNIWIEADLIHFLEQKATLMLGWLSSITYENGDIPLFNDSARGIAPHSNELFSYAKRLSLSFKATNLSSSGYRKIKKEQYEAIVDVAEVGAPYLAGHAHADTFNFELRIHHKEFIVDTGVSTYQVNAQRALERSTSAHNTVLINEQNSSEVWGGFRVANRAHIINLEESPSKISATHDGYKKIAVLHQRTFTFEKQSIVIKDTLSKDISSQLFLHFHPDVSEEMIRNMISFENKALKLQSYQYALAYNQLVTAHCVVIEFNKELITRINIENNENNQYSSK